MFFLRTCLPVQILKAFLLCNAVLSRSSQWSCTPTRDMIFYTLGVTPAEPGYTKVRSAPRLGNLRWARGHVPTPQGLVAVEVTQESVLIDSPVPVVFDLPEREPEHLAPGKHKILST